MESLHKLTSKKGGALKIELRPDLGKPVVDPLMIQKCFELLLAGTAALCEPGTFICLKADEITLGDAAGIRIAISLQGQKLEDAQIAPLFAILTEGKSIEISLNFLTALFMIHHHAGEVLISREPQKDSRFEVLLPLDFRKVEPRSTEEDYLQKLYRHFDAWDAALL